jgi:hypothetical protein
VLSHVDRDNHQVASRVGRATHGIVYALPVKANDEEHVRRKHQWDTDPTGDCYVPGYFKLKLRKVRLLRSTGCEILDSHYKGTHVREEMEFRESFSLTKRNPTGFGMQVVRLLCYQGSLSDPKWVDQDPCKFLPFFSSCSCSDVDHCSVFLHTLYYPRRPK